MTIFLRYLAHRPVYTQSILSLGIKRAAPLWHLAGTHMRSDNMPSLAGRCTLHKRPLHSGIEKVLCFLMGLKFLTLEEKKEAIVTHQKLWVAHYSIHNHEEVHFHYEMFYSMQLEDNPKDFSTQKYYLGLLEKKKEDLTREEIREMVDLYRFAIKESELSIWHWPLRKKLAEYHALLLTS